VPRVGARGKRARRPEPRRGLPLPTPSASIPHRANLSATDFEPG
jgi:hypothetical protein